MSVQYDGKHSIDIWFGGSVMTKALNTWTNFRLIPLNRPYINSPDPHTMFEQLQGTNERVYLSAWLKEDRVYGMREGEWEFQMFPLPNIIPNVEERIATILGDSDMWAWDPFNFSTGNTEDAISAALKKRIIYSIIPSKKLLIELPSVIYGVEKTGDCLEYTFIVGDSIPNSFISKAIRKEFMLGPGKVEKVNEERYYYTFKKNIYANSHDARLAYRNLVEQLNGQLVAVRLIDDYRDQCARGRLSINNVDTSDGNLTLTVGYKLYASYASLQGNPMIGYLVEWYDYDGSFIYGEVYGYGQRPTIYSEPNNPVGLPSEYHNAPEDDSAPDDPVKCNRHHIKKGGNLTLAYRDARDPESNTYIHTEEYMCETGDSYRFKIDWLHLEDNSSESLWYPLELETSEEKYIFVSGTLESPNDTIVIDVMPAFIVEEDKLYLFNLEQYRFWIKTNVYSEYTTLNVY